MSAAKMIRPVYVPQGPDTMPDIYGACYDFVKAFAFPGVDGACIFEDASNDASRPKGSNEFAIISILGGVRRGTTVERFINTGADDDKSEKLELRTLYEALVQVDLYSDSKDARRRAHTMETLARSSVGVSFFGPYGIGCNYADDVRELTYTDEQRRIVHRYMVTLHLSFWGGVDVGTAWFTDAKLNRVEDVDAYHKPTGE
jgi:hypothetical protein